MRVGDCLSNLSRAALIVDQCSCSQVTNTRTGCMNCLPSGVSEALGGVSRISFQMNAASLPQVKMMRAIDAIGARVLPALHQAETDAVK